MYKGVCKIQSDPITGLVGKIQSNILNQNINLFFFFFPKFNGIFISFSLNNQMILTQ